MSINKTCLSLGIVCTMLGFVIIGFFLPEYPCSASGVGCESVFEMLRDEAPGIIAMCFFLVGFVLLLNGVELGKNTGGNKK